MEENPSHQESFSLPSFIPRHHSRSPTVSLVHCFFHTHFHIHVQISQISQQHHHKHIQTPPIPHNHLPLSSVSHHRQSPFFQYPSIPPHNPCIKTPKHTLSKKHPHFHPPSSTKSTPHLPFPFRATSLLETSINMEGDNSNVCVDMEIKESPSEVTDGSPLGSLLSDGSIMQQTLPYLDVSVLGLLLPVVHWCEGIIAVQQKHQWCVHAVYWLEETSARFVLPLLFLLLFSYYCVAREVHGNNDTAMNPFARECWFLSLRYK